MSSDEKGEGSTGFTSPAVMGTEEATLQCLDWWENLDAVFTKLCISCHPVDLKLEAQRTIFESASWRVVLRTDDQSWLGRCIFIPMAHVGDFTGLPMSQLRELYHVRTRVCAALRKLFGMSYDNWMQLGNLTRDHEGKETDDVRYFHLHYHLIPRYRKPAVLNDVEYPDPQFGKPLNIDTGCGHKKLVLDKKDFADLANKLRTELADTLRADGLKLVY